MDPGLTPSNSRATLSAFFTSWQSFSSSSSLVNSCALARLSTAIARNTLRSVSAVCGQEKLSRVTTTRNTNFDVLTAWIVQRLIFFEIHSRNVPTGQLASRMEMY